MFKLLIYGGIFSVGVLVGVFLNDQEIITVEHFKRGREKVIEHFNRSGQAGSET